MKQRDMKPGDAELFNKAAARAVRKARPSTTRYKDLITEIEALRNGASTLLKHGIITTDQHMEAYVKANALIEKLGK
jgi:hypothetical protein